MFYDFIYLAKGFRMRPKVRSTLKANCLAMESVANIEMDRFFSLFQTTTSCCKWSKI